MKIRLIVPNQYQGVQPNPLGRLEDRPALCVLDVVATYGRKIAEIAGGFTATQATGGWIDGSNLLVVEPVTVFDCYIDKPRCEGYYKGGCGDTFSEHPCKGCEIDAFWNLAWDIAHELRQDCVYLEIDGEVEFIKP
jgi:hypothetical protein